jgi:hypothetical protein
MGPRLPNGLICRKVICARKYSVRGKVRGAGDFQPMVTAIPSKNATRCIISLSLLLGINSRGKIGLSCPALCSMCTAEKLQYHKR